MNQMTYFPRPLLADTLTALEMLADEDPSAPGWFERLGRLSGIVGQFQKSTNPEAVEAVALEADHLHATGQKLADAMLADAKKRETTATA